MTGIILTGYIPMVMHTALRVASVVRSSMRTRAAASGVVLYAVGSGTVDAVRVRIAACKEGRKRKVRQEKESCHHE